MTSNKPGQPDAEARERSEAACIADGIRHWATESTSAAQYDALRRLALQVEQLGDADLNTVALNQNTAVIRTPPGVHASPAGPVLTPGPGVAEIAAVYGQQRPDAQALATARAEGLRSALAFVNSALDEVEDLSIETPALVVSHLRKRLAER